MRTYITRDGDRLDTIVESVYENTTGAVESVLKANPGLASRPPILPAGVSIQLPDEVTTDNTRNINLWS